MQNRKKVLDNLFKSISYSKFSIFIFLITLVSSFSLGNLYYLSTQGPDFIRYKNYLNYFFINDVYIQLEQGFIYFIVITLFVTLRIQKYSNLNLLDSENIGNKSNFSYYNLSEFEIEYSLGIQEGNFFLYLIGLIGLYKLLKLKGFSKKNILLSFSVLNYLPVVFMTRLTLKPEILAFAIIPWILYSFEIYKINRKPIILFNVTTLIAILLSSKASIAGISIFYIILVNFKLIKELDIKKQTLTILLIGFITSGLFYENYKITGLDILTRAEINQEFGQLDYDNKATIDFLYNFNFFDLLKNPKNNFSNSFLSITLLDTFNDYFKLYWNQDYSLFKIDRKEFVFESTKNNFYFDKENHSFYLPIKFNDNITIDNLRYLIGLTFSIIFYIYVFYSLFSKKHNFKYIGGPFIGMFIVLLSSFGIPENNFDPKVGDTVKVFYYGFTLSFAFLFCFLNLINNKKYFAYFFSLFISLSFIFILGFPKENNSYLDYSLKKANFYTSLCELNNYSLKLTLIENEDISCNNSDNLVICKNIERLLDNKNNNFEFYINSQAVSFSDTEKCVELLETKYKFSTFKVLINKIPIFNFFIIIVSFIKILYLAIFVDNHKVLKR